MTLCTTESCCQSCGVVRPIAELIQTPQVISDGRTQIRGDCPDCGRFVMYVPQSEVPKFHFGKHAGHDADFVLKHDRPYCEWAIKNNVLKGRLLRYVGERL